MPFPFNTYDEDPFAPEEVPPEEMPPAVSFRPPAPMSTEQELDMVQEAMAPRGPFERGDRPGRPPGEGGGGGNVIQFPERRGQPPRGQREEGPNAAVGYRVWDHVKRDWHTPTMGNSAKDRLDLEMLIRRSGDPKRYQVFPVFE